MANSNDPGLRKMTHSPDELERFASLFIPTWELPADIGGGPDPGFQAAAIEPALVAALVAPQEPKPNPLKNTMMAVAPQLPAPQFPAPQAPAPQFSAPVAAAPMVPPRAFQPAASIDDDADFAPKKKGGKLFAIIGAVALIGGIGAFLALRSGDEPKEKAETKENAAEKPKEKKAMDLPEPTIAPAPPEEPTKAAAPEPTKAAPPKETATAKEPEKVAKEPEKIALPPPPVAKAAPPPPPPPVAKAAPPPPPPPAAKATPPPPPAKKAAPKIKDEF